MHPVLDVHLGALRANYRLLKDRHARKASAAVVKANAYGLGVEHCSKALWEEGCRDFFVATLAEAIELRACLPEASIGVFNGLLAGQEKDFLAHNLLPVLNEPGQLERWEKASPHAKAIIHVDTGMTRLGFDSTQLHTVAGRHGAFLQERVVLLMSHLACANEPLHPKNAEQLSRFEEAKKLLPNVRTSLCNSSGFFLDTAFHQELGRPGCALYGINPTEAVNPMQPVATLTAPILQIRTLDRDETVGYGGTYPAAKNARIAITGLGYADGWFRSQSNHGFAYVAGHKMPIAGRVSMDMIALDISQLPEPLLTEGLAAEFINEKQTVDVVAQSCQTIGYEIFTRLGRRIQRTYK